MIDLKATRTGDQVWMEEGRQWQRVEVVLVDVPRRRVCVTFVSELGLRRTLWRWDADLLPFHAAL